LRRPHQTNTTAAWAAWAGGLSRPHKPRPGASARRAGRWSGKGLASRPRPYSPEYSDTLPGLSAPSG
jgi:hypothetical protein